MPKRGQGKKMMITLGESTYDAIMAHAAAQEVHGATLVRQILVSAEPVLRAMTEAILDARRGSVTEAVIATNACMIGLQQDVLENQLDLFSVLQKDVVQVTETPKRKRGRPRKAG